jgi:hypothetical protein
MEKSKIYETSDLDLGAFLMLEGLKYLGCRLDTSVSIRKPLAVMIFHDDATIARDLERVFMTSNEKRYRDLTKYLLKEVHKKIRETNSKIQGE